METLSNKEYENMTNDEKEELKMNVMKELKPVPKHFSSKLISLLFYCCYTSILL